MIECAVRLFDPRHAVLDLSLTEKNAVLGHAAELAVSLGAGRDSEHLLAGLLEREAMAPTIVGKGVAVPHCKSDAVTNSVLLVFRMDAPVLWDSESKEQADVVFAIFTNSESTDHLAILAKLAGNLMHDDFLQKIRTATTSLNMFEIVNAVISGED